MTVLLPSQLWALPCPRLFGLMVVPQRMGLLPRGEWDFHIDEKCLFEHLLKCQEMPWIYFLIHYQWVVGKLKLALLVHFDLGKCGFCHCGSWFDKDCQKATRKQMSLEIIQVSNCGQGSELMCEEGLGGNHNSYYNFKSCRTVVGDHVGGEFSRM